MTAARSNARPRIAVVCHFPPPPGGMPVLAELFVRKLRAEGHEVVPIPTNLGATGLAHAIDATRGLRSLVRFPIFLLRLAIGLPRADVVHVMSLCGLAFALFTIPAVLVGRALGKRVLLHFHDGRARAFLASWGTPVLWVMRRAHVFVVPSGFLAEIFRAAGLHVEVIPNPSPLEGIRWQPADVHVRHAFIVARNLEPEYNVSCALRAFGRIWRRYPDATLVVLGSGTEEARLKAQARELNVADRVTFPGYVANERLPGFYSQASVLLNSSSVDNMPVSIIEAFGAGLPVVSTRAGGIPYMVEHDRTGLLVDLDDDEAMAQQACRLIEEPDLAARLVANARESAQRYTWSAVYGQFLDLYRAPALRPRSTP